MILELSLSLALAFGGPGAGYTLDLDARAVIDAPTASRLVTTLNGPSAPGETACGVSLGWIAFADPEGPCEIHAAEIAAHEREHLRQHSAIGPALIPLAALAPGAIEDYLPGATWYPRESEVGTCPLLRLEGSSPDRLDRLRVMPCYPSILGIRLPAP